MPRSLYVYVYAYLGVLLLRARDVARDVLHGGRVLVREPVGLALQPRLVHQHATTFFLWVGGELVFFLVHQHTNTFFWGGWEG